MTNVSIYERGSSNTGGNSNDGLSYSNSNLVGTWKSVQDDSGYTYEITFNNDGTFTADDQYGSMFARILNQADKSSRRLNVSDTDSNTYSISNGNYLTRIAKSSYMNNSDTNTFRSYIAIKNNQYLDLMRLKVLDQGSDGYGPDGRYEMENNYEYRSTDGSDEYVDISTVKVTAEVFSNGTYEVTVVSTYSWSRNGVLEGSNTQTMTFRGAWTYNEQTNILTTTETYDSEDISVSASNPTIESGYFAQLNNNVALGGDVYKKEN